jgi:hypothetical protein
MTHLVKRAPQLNKRTPTTSTRHHQRWAITRFVVKEIVTVDALMTPSAFFVFLHLRVEHVLPIMS